MDIVALVPIAESLTGAVASCALQLCVGLAVFCLYRVHLRSVRYRHTSRKTTRHIYTGITSTDRREGCFSYGQPLHTVMVENACSGRTCCAGRIRVTVLPAPQSRSQREPCRERPEHDLGVNDASAVQCHPCMNVQNQCNSCCEQSYSPVGVQQSYSPVGVHAGTNRRSSAAA